MHRNYYMRQNYIKAINLIDPIKSQQLKNASPDKIIAFCNKHNEKVSSFTRLPVPELPSFGKKEI